MGIYSRLMVSGYKHSRSKHETSGFAFVACRTNAKNRLSGCGGLLYIKNG